LSEERKEDEKPSRSKTDSRVSSFRKLVKSFGPGFVTGAADIDPSTVATYTQAGAKFGLGMLWMVLFQLPSMIALQEMCARIGLTSGKGLTDVIKRKYSNKVVYIISSLLLIVNTINIGADLGAMGASINLLIPQLPIFVATIIFSAIIVASEVIIPYRNFVRLLKYLTLVLFAYVITAIVVGGNWVNIFVATVTPTIQFTSDFTMMFVAVFGTTITPYLFFWQASEEAEEDVKKGKIKEIGKGHPNVSSKEISVMKKDVAVGMIFSQFMIWTIIITAAGSLHDHGLTNIQSTSQAAKALEPLVKSFPGAGQISKIIFALGIIGTGLLAIPILAGSSAYALSDTFGWRQGLNKKFTRAKKFYLVIIVSTSIGLWITYSNINIIQALIITAVINAVTSIPLLFILMRIANDKNILQNKTNGRLSNIVGWFTFCVMTISVAILFLSLSLR
jgi:NRAMP (natural resistance-associated macrophage protein)-like metal ion transporter